MLYISSRVMKPSLSTSYSLNAPWKEEVVCYNQCDKSSVCGKPWRFNIRLDAETVLLHLNWFLTNFWGQVYELSKAANAAPLPESTVINRWSQVRLQQPRNSNEWPTYYIFSQQNFQSNTPTKIGSFVSDNNNHIDNAIFHTITFSRKRNSQAKRMEWLMEPI